MKVNFFFGILVLILQRFLPSIAFLSDSVVLSSKNRFNHYALYGITKSKTAVLDGSSFNALDLFLFAEGTSTKANSGLYSSPLDGRHGYCHVITAKMANNERVVGIKVEKEQEANSLEKVTIDDGVEIYKDSMATIPKSISDDDAISTCVASLAGIHCALHNPISPEDKVVKNVGGSSFDFVSDEDALDSGKRKAVVVGGSDYASFLSDGLSAVGATVTQVTSNKMLRARQNGKVSVSPPEGNELGAGFASTIGKFDVLVDTLSDEGKVGESMCIGINNDWDDFSTNDGEKCSSAVILALKTQHNCDRYISTLCKAQQMVRDNGLIFGRNDAVKYTKDIESNPANKKANFILPPKYFGTRTLQKLLDSNIVLKSNNKSSSWSQGWSMKDFWELTSWPRDVTAAANVRFGFPVVDDITILSGNEGNGRKRMISAPPMRANTRSPPTVPENDLSENDNPYVYQIDGVDDFSSQILDEKKKCVLFLSSPSCRTCKYLTPQFNIISNRLSDSGVVFAKTNAFSKKGKELSRVLSVDAVPAFAFFRDGKRFGQTLNISRIPSKKFDLALELLQNGEWDAKRINMLDK